MKILLAIIISSFISFNAVAHEKPSSTTNPVMAQHQKLMSKINSIDVETLNSWNIKGQDFILLDVREPAEINAVDLKVDDKVNIPRGTVEFEFASAYPDKNRTIVVMCSHGIRSAIVTDILNSFGYQKVYNLKDGIFSWVNAGYRVSNYYGSFKIDAFTSSLR